MLKNLSWYTERVISEISLGGLVVLVLLRALQYNMARVRDKYLHTNCLAAIANMSSQYSRTPPAGLPPYIPVTANPLKATAHCTVPYHYERVRQKNSLTDQHCRLFNI